jgi:hypothetical protein
MRGQPQTIEVQPLDLRAAVGEIDEDNRTVELIFSTGAGVVRYDYSTGTRYLEKLSLDPSHVRLGRLNSGAPLLDSHSAYSITDQIGVAVEGSARIVAKKEGRVKVRFSKRESVEPIYRDVLDKITRNVSVGYRVHRFEESVADDEAMPVRLATDWEPFEVSMVPMGADAGAQAQVRNQKIATNQCVLVTRQQERSMAEENATRNDEQSEFIREDNPLAATEQRLALGTEERTEPSAAEAAMKAERERNQGILLAIRAAKMPSEMYDRLVAAGTPLVEAQRQIFIEMSKRVDPRTNEGPNPASRRAEMGDDPFIHTRAGIEGALLHRVAPDRFKLDDKSREYRGMTMLDVAKAYLQARGVRVTGMSKMDIAGAALGLTQVRGGVGMHTTTDFPLLLADVASKSLRAQYEAAPQTFSPLVRRTTLTDFRASNRLQLGDAPSLLLVNEHGEFHRGTIAEGKETIQLASYGRVFAITRKALVNDDLDAFSRVPQMFGRAAKNLESDLVWYQILANPTMGDSVALFNAAHHNYAGAGLIGLNTINGGQVAMMKQTGLDGTTLVNVQPKYLIVPPSQVMRALQFVSVNMSPTSATNINPFAGKLEVIADPRLEVGVTLNETLTAGSATAWYLAADPSQIDIIELAFLEGQEGPMVESRIGFDIDGLEIKCRHDVGAKVLDWRGLYKNDGSEES